MDRAVYCLSAARPCREHGDDPDAFCVRLLATAAELARAEPAEPARPIGYVTPASALLELGARAVAPGVLDQLTVVAPWPLPEALVASLLDAAAESASVRLAVPVAPETVPEAFAALNGLRLPGTALAREGLPREGWEAAAAELCEAWLFDPDSRVLVEPVATAFRAELGARTGGWRPPRGYEACAGCSGDAPGRRLTGAWSASAHAALLAWAPERLPTMSDGWLVRLRELCDLLTLDELRAAAHAAP